jgi:hypothetical protein
MMYETSSDWIQTIIHQSRQWLVPHVEFLFAHADSVDTIQKLFQTPLSGAYTFATMVSQLGNYLANVNKWSPNLTHADVLTHLATLQQMSTASPTIAVPCPTPQSSDWH